MRTLMRSDDFSNGMPANPAGCRENENRDGQRCERFRFAVAIRMVGIRRPRSDAKPRPHQNRRKDIQERFSPISNECVRVPEVTARELRDRQYRIQPDSTEHQLRAFSSASLRGRMMVRQLGRHRAKSDSAFARSPARN